MDFQVKLYDFLAFFLPGMLVISWILFVLLSFGIGLEILKYDLLVTLILFSLAYFVGNFIQALASIIERRVLLRIWGGHASVYLLDPKDKTLTSNYKDLVFRAYKAEFRFGVKQLVEDKKFLAEAFKVALSEFRKDREKIQSLNASFAFLRGVYLSAGILSLMSVCHLLLYRVSISTGFGDPGWLIPIIIVTAFWFCATFVLFARYKKRGEDLAVAVFDAMVPPSKRHL